MTAEIFDLEAERAKRAALPLKATSPATPAAPPQWRLSQRGNPYATIDGYHLVVFKRGGSWSFRIELTGTEGSGIRSGAIKPRTRRDRMRCWRCGSLDGLRARLEARQTRADRMRGAPAAASVPSSATCNS